MDIIEVPKNINSYTNIFYENVRWGDTDGMNHVNNVSIARYFESARVHIIRNLQSKKFSFIIVNFSINYLSQIYYPNKIEIGSSLSKIGNSSITIIHGLFVKGKCMSTAKSILAYTDLEKNKSKKITNKLKNKIIKSTFCGASDEI